MDWKTSSYLHIWYNLYQKPNNTLSSKDTQPLSLSTTDPNNHCQAAPQPPLSDSCGHWLPCAAWGWGGLGEWGSAILHFYGASGQSSVCLRQTHLGRREETVSPWSDLDTENFTLQSENWNPCAWACALLARQLSCPLPFWMCFCAPNISPLWYFFLTSSLAETGCSQKEGPKKGFVMEPRTQGVQEILEIYI